MTVVLRAICQDRSGRTDNSFVAGANSFLRFQESYPGHKANLQLVSRSYSLRKINLIYVNFTNKDYNIKLLLSPTIFYQLLTKVCKISVLKCVKQGKYLPSRKSASYDVITNSIR